MIDVVGGTYREKCLEPYWKETFGSGLRAVFALFSIDSTSNITYHTIADKKTATYLRSLKGNFPSLKIKSISIDETVEFYYDHPLITPIISPRPDTLRPHSKQIKVKGKNVLCFGMIEGQSRIVGDNVLYDPQSPANPIPFSKTGSKAKNLIVVVNLKEAERICNSQDINVIKEFFFKKEKVKGLIIKMGAKGAIVYEANKSHQIPVYKTDNVWSIGSGDVFSSMVFHKWTHGAALVEAAKFASKATAVYCNTKRFEFGIEYKGITPLKIKKVPTKSIYLAGPFFTFSQRWLINQVRDALLAAGLQVFSPLHDVGFGLARDVVDLDIKGLNDCGLVFAIVDGLDSGTLFEIGYAVSKKKKIIAYVQNEHKDSIKMLEGTHCIIEGDLSTAIYKSFWTLAEND